MNVTEADLRSLLELAEHSNEAYEARCRAIDNSSANCRTFSTGIRILYQPWRIRSSAADISPESIASRSCFLCPDRRFDWQKSLSLAPLPYEAVVNPYPVMRGHFTIISTAHKPQEFNEETAAHFTEIAFAWPNTTVFYNGAQCGASAPDHLHFQAIIGWSKSAADQSLAPHVTIKASTPGEAACRLVEALQTLHKMLNVDTTMVNIASVPGGDGEPPAFIVFPRRALRPQCYTPNTDESVGGYMVSPATIEMLGAIVTPRRRDFDSLTPDIVSDIFMETGIGRDSAVFHNDESHALSVGIMNAPTINFTLHTPYLCGSTIWLPGEYATTTPVTLVPLTSESRFTLHKVTIGKAFHWERTQSQTFTGILKIIDKTESGKEELTAINIVDTEDYLYSVIASEMSQQALPEFLKAHAVISRSWVMKQIENRKGAVAGEKNGHGTSPVERDSNQETIRWYDRDDHTLFDVCADDHCQRYQGIGHIVNDAVRRAVDETRAEVLVDNNGGICDARFSKCCGGKFEEFENCWQPVHYHYLESLTDTSAQSTLPDLRYEENAERWIKSSPEAFCNCKDDAILRQMMNNYDREQTDFYRWAVTYRTEELSEIIHSRSGIDFGKIRQLIPLTRGRSGRIVRLLIIGEKQSHIVGKELEIRRWLSRSHLRSSAFVVARSADGEEFTLRGAGWGHGVGLCQIGAAVMSTKGYRYTEILKHYFPGSDVEKR